MFLWGGGGGGGGGGLDRFIYLSVVIHSFEYVKNVVAIMALYGTPVTLNIALTEGDQLSD